MRAVFHWMCGSGSLPRVGKWRIEEAELETASRLVVKASLPNAI